MTPEHEKQLRELLELGKKATEGPWDIDWFGREDNVSGNGKFIGVVPTFLSDFENDIKFIVTARNSTEAIEALLAENTVLKAALIKTPSELHSISNGVADMGFNEGSLAARVKELEEVLEMIADPKSPGHQLDDMAAAQKVLKGKK